MNAHHGELCVQKSLKEDSMGSAQILAFMLGMMKFKRVLRDGWTRKFPEGHRFKSRDVDRSESDAEHSWSLSILAWIVATELGLNAWKTVRLVMIHDTPELKTGDRNTAVLEGEEQARAMAEKREDEEAAMHEIFDSMGEWGRQCIDLWLEYADQTSREARVAVQLDKLDACIQALFYRQNGQQVDPCEFFDHAAKYIHDPLLVAMLQELERIAAEPLPAPCTT